MPRCRAACKVGRQPARCWKQCSDMENTTAANAQTRRMWMPGRGRRMGQAGRVSGDTGPPGFCAQDDDAAGKSLEWSVLVHVPSSNPECIDRCCSFAQAHWAKILGFSSCNKSVIYKIGHIFSTIASNRGESIIYFRHWSIDLFSVQSAQKGNLSRGKRRATWQGVGCGSDQGTTWQSKCNLVSF